MNSEKNILVLDAGGTNLVFKAVKGMLPKNKLGRAQLKKLKVYAGSDHPHKAQQPAELVI